VDSAARAPGSTVVYIVWARETNRPAPRAPGSGAPELNRTGLAGAPEDWPAADLPRRRTDCCGVFGRCRRRRDAAAVTPREPQSHEARVWLVTTKISTARTVTGSQVRYGVAKS